MWVQDFQDAFHLLLLCVCVFFFFISFIFVFAARQAAFLNALTRMWLWVAVYVCVCVWRIVDEVYPYWKSIHIQFNKNKIPNNATRALTITEEQQLEECFSSCVRIEMTTEKTNNDGIRYYTVSQNIRQGQGWVDLRRMKSSGIVRDREKEQGDWFHLLNVEHNTHKIVRYVVIQKELDVHLSIAGLVIAQTRFNVIFASYFFFFLTESISNQ